ncbi:MAG: hypothetical protein WCA81_06185 [Rhizomicrobium sp.]
MTTQDDLLAEIEAFLARPDVDLPVTGFGRAVMHDGKFVADLRKGRRGWPETAEKIRAFIRDYTPKGEAAL